MMDLRQLRVFFAVAKHRSFAAAAREFGLNPAAVTRDISKLEKGLGVQLFVRTTRSVTLTTEGAAMAARLQPALDALEDALRSVQFGASGLHGQIKVSVPMSFGVRIMPDIVTRFRQQFAGISVYLSMNDELVDIISEGYDLAIRISEAPQDKSTIWRKICRIERLLVAAPGAPETAAATPDDLLDGRLLSYGCVQQREVWRLSRGHVRRKLVAGDRLGANNGDVLAELAEEGNGVALLPRFIVEDALAEGRLVEILPEWTCPTLWLTLYYPPFEKLPPVVATFSEFVERELLDMDAFIAPTES